jgi:rare lipoprotein A
MLERKWEDLAGHVLLGRYTLRSLLSQAPGQAEFLAHAAPPLEEREPLSITLIIPDEADFEGQLAQIEIARRLGHPNLLRILDGGQCAVNGTTVLFVVCEAAAVTLAEVVEKEPLDLAKGAALIDDLLAGLDYIHGQGFVCGRLQPETVVRAGGFWKIADLSQLHPAGGFDNRAAAASKTAVEASLARRELGEDMWALGTTLKAGLAEEIRRTPVVQATIAGCLEPDPAKRLQADEIRRLLDSLQPAPAVVLPKAPAGERMTPSGPGSPLTLTIMVLAAILLLAVLAGVAFHKQSAPAPVKVAVAPVPARTLLSPGSRPSPFSSKTDTKRGPAPQPLPSPPGTPYPTTQPALGIESATRSAKEDAGEGNVGRAVFFADHLNGQRTASGELFSNEAMTAAHPSLPFGTNVRVTNLRNNKTVVVRVNDRAPLSHGVVITVTRAAADQLGFVQAGFAQVRVEPMR